MYCGMSVASGSRAGASRRSLSRRRTAYREIDTTPTNSRRGSGRPPPGARRGPTGSAAPAPAPAAARCRAGSARRARRRRPPPRARRRGRRSRASGGGWAPGMDDASARVPWVAMPAELKPRLRGVFHQWAFFVSLVAGAVLVAAAPTGRAAAAGAIYAAALAGMFGASALYHRVAWRPSLAPWFRRLDHSMIFVLIAGTSTPVIVLGLEGVLPVVVLVVVWAGALLGALLNLVWIGAPRQLVASVYVLLGWVGVV